MTLLRSARLAMMGLLVAALLVPAGFAQDGYRTPPDAITKILDAPGPPAVSVSSDRRWLLITTADVPETSIAELAEPTLFLAGRRFQTRPRQRIDLEGVRTASLKPVDGGAEVAIPVPAGARLTIPQWSRDAKRLAYFVITPGRMALHIFDTTTKSGRAVTASGGQLQGRLAPAGGWSKDGKHFLFSATTGEGEALWVAEVDAATAKRLTPPSVNYVAGGCSWTAGHAPAVCLLFPEGRGTEPKTPDAPAGPIVQESYGRAVPARTNTYLLKDRHDEALLDYYMTSQLAAVALDGKVTPLGKPAVHAQPLVSPDGKYLLVRMTHRPYSYQVGMGNFPVKTEVWAPDGSVVKTVNDRPLIDAQPSMRDSTTPGIRTITWRADEPATLVLVQALDDGDPRKTVPKRDRVSMLKAPFAGEPQPFIDTELRYGGVQWLSPKVAILSDFSSQRTRARTWVIDPSLPDGGTPRPLWDYNIEDRIAAPGNLQYQYDRGERSAGADHQSGRPLFLSHRARCVEGQGRRPALSRSDGNRDGQDRTALAVGAAVLREHRRARGSSRKESDRPPRIADRTPRLLLRRRPLEGESRLTTLPDPAPFFSTVKAELITYTRPDGVKLSGTMYLPPGYNRARDGKLPFFLWAYPQEFRSEDAASQVAGSPYQFRRPSRADHLLLLAAGYGVLDNPTMPIVGQDGKEPNDAYVPQLIASAKAAIDKLEELGVGDRDRMAVGGHSYGAFMTGNLLAHSDLFRAGIARSGAYNRTLTPFGFQAEPRNYWQAPEVYDQMSPFHFADKIKEPILLIHGTHDNNQGTFPVQSERMFAAIKGNGGNVRYVQLPLESHGYIAKESRRHVIWEMVNWLDTHVKQPKKSTSQ